MDLEDFDRRMCHLDVHTMKILPAATTETNGYDILMIHFDKQTNVIQELNLLPDKFIKSTSSLDIQRKEEIYGIIYRNKIVISELWKLSRILSENPVHVNTLSLCQNEEHLKPELMCWWCFMECLIKRYEVIGNIELRIKQIKDLLSPEDCINICENAPRISNLVPKPEAHSPAGSRNVRRCSSAAVSLAPELPDPDSKPDLMVSHSKCAEVGTESVEDDSLRCGFSVEEKMLESNLVDPEVSGGQSHESVESVISLKPMVNSLAQSPHPPSPPTPPPRTRGGRLGETEREASFISHNENFNTSNNDLNGHHESFNSAVQIKSEEGYPGSYMSHKEKHSNVEVVCSCNFVLNDSRCQSCRSPHIISGSSLVTPAAAADVTITNTMDCIPTINTSITNIATNEFMSDIHSSSEEHVTEDICNNTIQVICNETQLIAAKSHNVQSTVNFQNTYNSGNIMEQGQLGVSTSSPEPFSTDVTVKAPCAPEISQSAYTGDAISAFVGPDKDQDSYTNVLVTTTAAPIAPVTELRCNSLIHAPCAHEISQGTCIGYVHSTHLGPDVDQGPCTDNVFFIAAVPSTPVPELKCYSLVNTPCSFEISQDGCTGYAVSTYMGPDVDQGLCKDIFYTTAVALAAPVSKLRCSTRMQAVELSAKLNEADSIKVKSYATLTFVQLIVSQDPSGGTGTSDHQRSHEPSAGTETTILQNLQDSVKSRILAEHWRRRKKMDLQ